MYTDRWMYKDVIHIYNGILAIKKEQNNAIRCNMDATRVYHTKQSKPERQIPYDNKKHYKTVQPFNEEN